MFEEESISVESEEFISRLMACGTGFRCSGNTRNQIWSNLDCMRMTMDRITKHQLCLWNSLRGVFPDSSRLRAFEKSIADLSMPDEEQFVIDLCTKVFHLKEEKVSVVLALLVDDDPDHSTRRRRRIVTPLTLKRDLALLNRIVGHLKKIKWSKFEFKQDWFYLSGEEIDNNQFVLCCILAFRAMIKERNPQSQVEAAVREFLEQGEIKVLPEPNSPQYTDHRFVDHSLWDGIREDIAASLNIESLHRARYMKWSRLTSVDLLMHDFLNSFFPNFADDLQVQDSGAEIEDILDLYHSRRIGARTAPQEPYMESNQIPFPHPFQLPRQYPTSPDLQKQQQPSDTGLINIGAVSRNSEGIAPVSSNSTRLQRNTSNITHPIVGKQVKASPSSFSAVLLDPSYDQAFQSSNPGMSHSPGSSIYSTLREISTPEIHGSSISPKSPGNKIVRIVSNNKDSSFGEVKRVEQISISPSIMNFRRKDSPRPFDPPPLGRGVKFLKSIKKTFVGTDQGSTAKDKSNKKMRNPPIVVYNEFC